MKVLRSSFVAAVAIFAAACGDKVNIVQTDPNAAAPSAVTAVVVSPTAATMSINQTVNFTAAVTATGTAATTVTWSSTDASKVSVSATGVATAVAATPGVAVCATSTVNVNAKGCATVVVSSAPTTIPATVSIQSITLNNAGLNNPVNPASVQGTIDVRANVAAGTETVTKIVVLVGTTRADSQTFSAAQSAALRYASDVAVAEQSAFPPILFTIATNKFNGTTGAPVWVNGNYAVSVVLYTSASATAARSTATYQTPLSFANADTYVATLTTAGTVANATATTGFRYDRGNVVGTALPVVYSGRTVAAATLLFGSACDASGVGTRSIAMAVSGSTWTGTLPYTIPSGGSQANTVNNYEFAGASGIAACTTLNATGETIAVTATDANGDAILATAAPQNAAAINSLRLDNRAPAVGNPALQQNPNTRGNGWVNASINFVSRNSSATSNGVPIRPAAAVCAAAGVFAGTVGTFRDCGEGTYTYQARIGPNTTGTLTDVRTLTPSTTPTLPARSATATTYCVLITAIDALGNESLLSSATAAATNCTVPAATPTALAAGVNHTLFGVDLDAPTITLLGTATTPAVATALDANERRNGATVTNAFTVAVADTGTIGNSGMLAGSGVMGTVAIRNDAASTAYTAAQKCPTGLDGDGLCTNVQIGTTPAAGGIVATTGAQTPTAALPGYYTFTALGRDAAGNSTATVSRVIGFNTVTLPTLTSALFNAPISGTSVTFSALASSNFDLWKSTYTVTYAGGLVGPILYPPATLNSFNGTQLFSNAPAGITITGFMRSVQAVTANAAVTVGALFAPTTLTGIVTDQGNNNSAASATTLTGFVAAGTSLITGVAAPVLTNSWSISNAATNISTGAGPAAAVNPLVVTINADASGPTATYNSPFVRVDLYAQVGANLEQIGSATTYSTLDDGSAMGRRHRFSISWTPGTKSPISSTNWVLGAQNLYAIGVSANGDALVTPVSALITLTNP